MPAPLIVLDTESALNAILETIGPRLIVGTPLGLGKPNLLLNALFERVARDSKLSLQLLTALSLDLPPLGKGLQRRFLGPFLQRHFGDAYPRLSYLSSKQAPPSNIQVTEFYLASGSALGNAQVQRRYACLNYTHVAREMASRQTNLVLQFVARRVEADGRVRYSLSCNPDLTLDLVSLLIAQGRPPLVVGVVHPELAFLANDAEVSADFFGILLEDPAPQHWLFAIPRSPVNLAEFALGLHASTLVRDGGTLQIGIGALSDAVVHALLLRDQHQAVYLRALERLQIRAEQSVLCAAVGGTAPLKRGLYGASEMVMDAFMHLRRAGILKRLVYDDLPLQKLLNAGEIADQLEFSHAARIVQSRAIKLPLDAAECARLVHFGLLPTGSEVHGNWLRAGAREIAADDSDALIELLTGRTLRNGRYLHGGFWAGSRPLQEWLAQLQGADLDGLCMTRISHINELYGGSETLQRAQRKDARFFNTCMLMNALGAATSDALDSGQVVSGVGGQYNFVAMAHALSDGRSVLMLRSTRESAGKLQSNIVWNYGHCTIPRHLRDLVVTEYGIADLRGKCDEDCVIAMLSVCDARFQAALCARAIAEGKLRADFRIPESYLRNTPEALSSALAPLAEQGHFPQYPFGSDFTAEELRLVAALTTLKQATATPWARLRTIAKALSAPAPVGAQSLLERMDLAHPSGWQQHLEQRLLLWALGKGDAS